MLTAIDFEKPQSYKLRFALAGCRMTQNRASLRWKKPGFEQKFLMQGEKQVPETSGCRRFYSGSNINFHLYAYAGNNPVKYIDPDGRDIEEVPVLSVTAGFCAAARLSVGVAVDSKGNIAIYGKIEGGVGAGADTGLDKPICSFSKGISLLSKVIDSITYTESCVEFLGNVISLPEDTGEGNLSAGLSLKGETIKDWVSVPVVGAFFGGVESDKRGKIFPSIGIQAIAAAFFVSGTVYGTIYSKEHAEQTIESFSNEYHYYEQQLLDYYTQEWYEQ